MSLAEIDHALDRLPAGWSPNIAANLGPLFDSTPAPTPLSEVRYDANIDGPVSAAFSTVEASAPGTRNLAEESPLMKDYMLTFKMAPRWLSPKNADAQVRTYDLTLTYGPQSPEAG